MICNLFPLLVSRTLKCRVPTLFLFDPQREYVTAYWSRIRVLSSPSEGRLLAAVIINDCRIPWFTVQIKPSFSDQMSDQTKILRSEFSDQTKILRPEFSDQTKILRPEFSDQTKFLRPEFSDQTKNFRSEFTDQN